MLLLQIFDEYQIKMNFQWKCQSRELFPQAMHLSPEATKDQDCKTDFLYKFDNT